MKQPNLPLVAVTWNDAYVTTTQFEAHGIPHTPVIVTTYGLLLRDDDVGVSVASEVILEGEGSYRGVTFIPRGMVAGMIKLKGKKATSVGPLPPVLAVTPSN